MEEDIQLDAKTIAEFRKKENMTQQDLAQLLGVGIATVNRWERNLAKPSGTAEVILKTAILSSVVPAAALLPTLPLNVGVSAFGIYKLLKKSFENNEN